MTYIPDCRRDETYNEKYLNKKDKEFLRGFDWCCEMAVDNFFDNDMDELQDEFTYLGHVLSEELPGIMQIEYEYETIDGVEKRKIKTYADLVRSKILDWIEMERDELITSMIDGMSDEEYQEIKERVDNDRGRKGE